MAGPSFIFDSAEVCSGVSGANPTLVPRNLASSLVNRWPRYDENKPRPAFTHIELEYYDDADGNNKKLLEAGNIQGAFFYQGYPSHLRSFLIVSVAGTIFAIGIIGKKGYVKKLFTGNDPVFTHCWFAQAFDWLIIQDGSARPILWSGGSSIARRAIDGEVPTGSVMATIHGRLAVASSDGTNQIAVGDIVYGSDATTTIDVIKFTETQYWASGGAFGAPVFVGDIMSLYPMPYLDTGTGQNELVILGSNGTCALDLSGPRNSWLDRSILRISLVGGGCASSHSCIAMNGELFYRSLEGVRAYKNARIEFQQTWKQSPISNDVRRWIEYDSPALLQYASQVTWNNLLLSTVQPRIAAPNNPFAGHHRYHLGMVVLDAAPESNTLREGAPIWQGMWTGIRPICFVEGQLDGQSRCFAFSHDCDGRNRLYEIDAMAKLDTWDGNRSKIISSYTTGNLGVIERVANNFTPKKLSGGSLEFSDIREEVDVEVKYRPNDSPCYLTLDEFKVGCDCALGDCGKMFTMPTFKRQVFESPKRQCIPGTSDSADYVFHTQVKVKMEGWAKIERLRLKFDRQEEAEIARCSKPTCEPYQCCENDYYCFANGPEPDVPFIERPSDVPVFSATATVTVTCPPGTVGASITITSTATSEISFEDAMAKAKMNAAQQALAQLECCNCTPEVGAAFVGNSNVTDLSSLFDAGSFQNDNCGARPWRLIETVTEIEYATGYVDVNGSLIVTWVLPGYSTYFDDATKTFVDGGMTDAYMALEVGCSDGGGSQWPDTPDYFTPA